MSPKPPVPDPNLNPFSPLSPDLPGKTMRIRDADEEVNRLLGLDTVQKRLVIYTRHQLLQTSKGSNRHNPPAGMEPLENWYGPPAKSNNVHVEDPAIASIGSPGGSTRRGGGFGEGFGYGGGIGSSNRGLGGRGGRNIGLRRQPESALDVNGLPIDTRGYGGQMGRFSVKNPLNTTMRLGGEEVSQNKSRARLICQPKKDRRREDEWRRSDRDHGRMPRDPARRPNFPREEDTAEPAWMDDVAPNDPAIVDNSDPLVQFIPGEDMIAAHKRAMRARDVGTDWRGDGGNLPAFFGADPAIASSSVPSQPPIPGLKSKSFNAANYLKQTEDVSDEEQSVTHQVPPASNASAFSSRFQKFFSPPNEQASVVADIKPAEELKDDLYTPSPSEQYRHLSSPLGASDGPPAHHLPSPHYHSPSHSPPPAPHANALLQQLYGNTQERQQQHSPDPLQLLNQAQRQGFPQRPAAHMSMPPQFARSPTHMYGQDELNSVDTYHTTSLNRQQHPHPFPNGPPQPSFLPPPPPPPFFPQGHPRPPPPGMPGYLVPNFPPAGQQGAPPRPYPPLGPAQQDMLATLFAGLGPRN
uniref:Uncharacterized protein n=1 Tax=Kwoniella dejecticola CBS 10117 TaxID=1296121 RepID=A0A1A5ZW02_9TREE|nr:uncharacterized protein I303_07895 [Kwoniella dejecticola CBS 10117]OBR81982.1 hypothetical protein I303_07895 [Kwoniella dejecticola CBS 10117]